jgi:3'-5' exonuclease
MLDNVFLENVLFLDIETVPQYPSFSEMPADMHKHWEKKSTAFRKENESAADVYERAGIYAEFGRIICISVGHLAVKDGLRKLRIKSFAGDDEKQLLIDFSAMIIKFAGNREVDLCAHNGREFDFPYIARRLLINGLKLPKLLDIAGKKPWEVRFLDTLELWKFGDYKHYTSLDLLTRIFGIPTPKDDLDGSMVARTYWQERDLPRIVTYCQKDVGAIVQLLLRYKGEALLEQSQIEILV